MVLCACKESQKKVFDMSDSILEKVISQKEFQQKESFNPVEIIAQLLTGLSEKEADVLRRRFGLETGKKETLETIGNAYGVTRERIRQIENQSIQKLKKSSVFGEIVKPIEHLVISILEDHGGIVMKEMMYEHLLGVDKGNKKHQQSINFIIHKLMSDTVESVSKSAKYRASWKMRIAALEAIDQVIDVLASIINKAGRPQSFEEIFEQFAETDLYGANPAHFPEGVIFSCLHVSAEFGKNPFDEYGLSSWGLISPKRMHDRVYLVLQKKGEPMHFEDIAGEIATIFAKKAYPPTVHNELILNDDYVLVGRGIYALKNWGYKEGVVSEVIMEVLKDSDEPLTRAEIVDKVLEQRIVKKNTVHLALTDKSIFKKTSDGKYSVSEHKDSKKVE